MDIEEDVFCRLSEQNNDVHFVAQLSVKQKYVSLCFQIRLACG